MGLSDRIFKIILFIWIFIAFVNVELRNINLRDSQLLIGWDNFRVEPATKIVCGVGSALIIYGLPYAFRTNTKVSMNEPQVQDKVIDLKHSICMWVSVA